MTSTWRTHPYRYKGYLWLLAPPVVWSADLDTTNTNSNGKVSGTDIIQYLFFDTEWVGDPSWLKEGMTVALGTEIGDWSYGWVRLRGTTTYMTETVLMVWASGNLSEAGRPGELFTTTGAVITVFDDYRVWAKMPYISVATGYWDGANGPAGTTWKQFPVANAGGARVAFESGGSYAFDFDGSNSRAIWEEGYLGQLTAYGSASSFDSSSENGGNIDDNAFDGNGGTYWEATSGSGEWISWNALSTDLRRISITAESATTAPNEFYIQRYNTYYGWVTIAEVKGETGWSAGETRTFFCDCYYPDVGSWSTYRLYVVVNNGAGTIAIREIAMHTEDRASTSPYTWDAADGTYDSGSSTSEAPTISFPVGFRYVELSVEDAASTYTGETHTPVLVATLTPTNTAVDLSGATATSSTGTDPDEAIDGSIYTSWQSASSVTSGWLKVDMGVGNTARASAYRLTAFGVYAPTDWTVEGSNDGSTWYLLDTRADQSFDMATYDTQTFTFRGAVHDYRYYRLTITAIQGGTQLRVHEFELYMDTTPYAPITDFTVREHRHGQDGQRMVFEVNEAIPYSTYPPGTLALYWEQEYYAGVAGSLATAGVDGHTVHWGWLDEAREGIHAEALRTSYRTEITVLDVAGRLAQLPGFPFVIEHDNTGALPAYYNQMAGACIDRLIYLIGRWCSSAAEVTDLIISDSLGMWTFPILEVAGGSLWEMMRGRAEAAEMRLGCTKHGAVKWQPDFQMINISIVDILPDPTVSLTGDDITSLDYTSTPTPRLHWGWAAAVKVAWDDPSTTAVVAYRAVSPGDTPGQGLRGAEQNEMLVLSQSNLNRRAAQLYAYENAPLSRLSFALAHAGDTGLDPGDMQYIGLTLVAAYAARRGITWSAEKMWLWEIEYRHLPNHTKDVVIRVEDYIDGGLADTVS